MPTLLFGTSLCSWKNLFSVLLIWIQQSSKAKLCIIHIAACCRLTETGQLNPLALWLVPWGPMVTGTVKGW